VVELAITMLVLLYSGVSKFIHAHVRMYRHISVSLRAPFLQAYTA